MALFWQFIWGSFEVTWTWICFQPRAPRHGCLGQNHLTLGGWTDLWMEFTCLSCGPLLFSPCLLFIRCWPLVSCKTGTFSISWLPTADEFHPPSTIIRGNENQTCVKWLVNSPSKKWIQSLGVLFFFLSFFIIISRKSLVLENPSSHKMRKLGPSWPWSRFPRAESKAVFHRALGRGSTLAG